MNVKTLLVISAVFPMLLGACAPNPLGAVATQSQAEIIATQIVPMTGTPRIQEIYPTAVPATPKVDSASSTSTLTHSLTVQPSTPTLVITTPSATVCVEELVWPQLMRVEPNEVTRGSEFKLTGQGGYVHNTCGAYIESARSFEIYLDNYLVGEVVCYINYCEGRVMLPLDSELGSHCLSAQPGNCDLEILVVDG
jgi:hypothetical protein